MDAFAVLADPVRRRIVTLIAEGERSAGDIVDHINAEFGISQSGVSQHLRVLRSSGFAAVRADGTRRLYSLDPTSLAEIDDWIAPYRHYWRQRLDALETEIKRNHPRRRTP